jgi:type I restriction enzyme R subunit
MTRNEPDLRADLIEPALKKAGWGVVERSQIRREFSISDGRLTGAGGQMDTVKNF